MSFSLRTGHTNQTPGGNSYDGGGIGGNRSVSFFVKTGHINLLNFRREQS